MALAHLITRNESLCPWFLRKRSAAAYAVHIDRVRRFNFEAEAMFDL